MLCYLNALIYKNNRYPIVTLGRLYGGKEGGNLEGRWEEEGSHRTPLSLYFLSLWLSQTLQSAVAIAIASALCALRERNRCLLAHINVVLHIRSHNNISFSVFILKSPRRSLN